MFDERPYRKRKSSSTLWWVAGAMAIGLTVWHLELQQYPWAEISFLRGSLSDNDSQTHQASENHDFVQPGSQNNFQHVMTAQTEPSLQSIPGSSYGVDEGYQSDIQLMSAQQPVTSQANKDKQPVNTSFYSRDDVQYFAENADQQLPMQQQALQEYRDKQHQDHSLQTEQEQEITNLRELSEQYWQRGENVTKLIEQMRPLSEKIYLMSNTHYLPAYQVKPGEQLRLIAREYQVSWEYLAQLNHIHPQHLQSGQKLKVIQGPFGAVVDLSDFRLTIHAHGYYVKDFPIGTGKNQSTPQGTFLVKNKETNPTYYGPDGVIGRNDPLNPLGERWIDIGNSFGIHGTIDPDSIGQQESKGCIRLLNDDVAEVYDFLTVGSEVIIRH